MNLGYKRILIFAGTTEGRKLTGFLQTYNVRVFVSVATSYGKECIASQENALVMEGRMDQNQIEAFLFEYQIDLVIDATHPHARIVTENIKAACEKAQILCLRCLREVSPCPEDAVIVENIAQAVDFLDKTTGNILITTGSKELAEYTRIDGYQGRCYARVLSTSEAVEESIRLGFEGAHLFAMQGPFSEEMNVALIHQVDAQYFVTKESGHSGGFAGKLEAARRTGAALVVIGRPKEKGQNMEEICGYLEAHCRE